MHLKAKLKVYIEVELENNVPVATNVKMDLENHKLNEKPYPEDQFIDPSDNGYNEEGVKALTYALAMALHQCKVIWVHKGFPGGRDAYLKLMSDNIQKCLETEGFVLADGKKDNNREYTKNFVTQDVGDLMDMLSKLNIQSSPLPRHYGFAVVVGPVLNKKENSEYCLHFRFDEEGNFMDIEIWDGPEKSKKKPCCS